MKKDKYRVFIKGGILTPGELKQIVQLAKHLNLDYIGFGSRQDIILNLDQNTGEIPYQMINNDIEIIRDINLQNIVCSYVSSDLFESTSWLKGVKYLHILEKFQYQPELKINICDPKQQLVPLFSGELNFIASHHEDYWYLFIKIPKWHNDSYFPYLIYSWDIPIIAEAIEANHEDCKNLKDLSIKINKRYIYNKLPLDKPLNINYAPFPYYEGMNLTSLERYWLGLYWRNNQYDLNFLEAFCDFCMMHRIGKICITPWKSFIVKGINKMDKSSFEQFLGQKGINIRHSSFELNWHLPVANDMALQLKKSLVTQFNQFDISTFGLTFSISEATNKNPHFTAIVIVLNTGKKHRMTYDLLHAKKFDPNTQKYITYAQDINQKTLAKLIIELSQKHFELLSGESRTNSEAINNIENKYQCKNCHSVYDEIIGDPTQNIPANTAFEQLPKNFTCNICESPLSDFSKMSK